MAAAQTAAGDVPGNDSHNGNKHNILTIPLEMFERIAELAEPEDLLNLRLVNRETADRVERNFIATHFSERMFLISYQDNLETLLAIANHPQFGNALRVVYLCNEELPGPDHPLIQNGRCVKRWERVDDNSIDSQIFRELQDREWLRLVEEQKQFLERDGDVHMLVRTFQAFQRNGNIPAVMLMDQEEAAMSARGARTMERLSGRKLIWGMDDNRPVKSPLVALTLADFPLTSLTVGFDNFGWDIFELVRDEAVRESARAVFHNLKHLNLFSRSDMHDPTNLKIATDAAAIFGDCVNLERLEIDVWTPAMHPDVVCLNIRFLKRLFGQEMPRMQELHLAGFFVDFVSLVLFIRRQRELARVAVERNDFFLLGDYDDHRNDKHGRHAECVETLLREATGLADVSAYGSRVPEWGKREQESEDGDEDEDASSGSSVADAEESNE